MGARRPSEGPTADCLRRKEYRELTASQVCDLAGIRREAFAEHVGDLLDFDVVTVEEDGASGDERVYRLNADSDLARNLKELQFDLLSAVAERN